MLEDKIGPIDDRAIAAADLKMAGEQDDAVIAEKVGLPNAAAVKAALRAPNMQGYLAKYLDDAGATLESAARVIAEAENAMATKFFAHEGQIIDREDVVDHPTRLAAAELNLKARGELRDSSVSANIFVGMSDEQVAQIAAGQIDPATLIDVGPRISNPAGK